MAPDDQTDHFHALFRSAPEFKQPKPLWASRSGPAVKIVVLQGRRAQGELTRTGRHGAIALSDLGEQWVLLNVAPNLADLLADLPGAPLGADPRLQLNPQLARSLDAPVRTVVLTDAQVDHVSGLLNLRDGAPIELYATPAVFEVLTQAIPVLPILQQYCGVHWHVIPVAGETLAAQFRVAGMPSLAFTALATEGLEPPCLPESDTMGTTGLSIALVVEDTDTGQRLFCAPAAKALGRTELDWLRDADCVMLNRHTTWQEDRYGGTWRAQRKVLFESGGPLPSPAPGPAGFESAYDGMVITL